MANTFAVQKPKLAVVEVYMLRHMLENNYDENRKRNQYTNAIAAYPLTAEKYQAAKELVPESQVMNAFLYFPMYHRNYDGMQKADAVSEQYDVRGFEMLFADMSDEEIDSQFYSTANISEGNIIDQENEYNLERIKALCEKENVPLLLLVVPFQASEDEMKGLKAIETWALENSVPFLDMNVYSQEIGIDWKMDMVDAGHANYIGATKNALWLGEELKANYELPDRRNNPKYKNWETSDMIFEHQKLENELGKAESLDEYFTCLMREENTSLLTGITVGYDASEENRLYLTNQNALLNCGSATLFQDNAVSNHFENLEDIVVADMKQGIFFDIDNSTNRLICSVDGNVNSSSVIGITVYSEILQKCISQREF